MFLSINSHVEFQEFIKYQQKMIAPVKIQNIIILFETPLQKLLYNKYAIEIEFEKSYSFIEVFEKNIRIN